jgi:hypothetical protein
MTLFPSPLSVGVNAKLSIFFFHVDIRVEGMMIQTCDIYFIRHDSQLIELSIGDMLNFPLSIHTKTTLQF